MWSLELDCTAFLDDTKESSYFSKCILSLVDIQSDSHRKENFKNKSRRTEKENTAKQLSVLNPMCLYDLFHDNKSFGVHAALH